MCNTHVYISLGTPLNLFSLSVHIDITVEMEGESWVCLPPFLYEEFDISLGLAGLVLVLCRCATHHLGGRDRSVAATEESIRGGSCRTG